MYELLLTLHLLAAVTWVGGSIALTVIAARASAGDRAVVAPYFNWYGGRVITGAAFVLIIAGAGLVGHLEFVEVSDLWIILAIVGWVASAALGMAVLGPTGAKLEAATGEQADTLFRRLLTFQYLDTAIVVLVVIDMAVKPGG